MARNDAALKQLAIELKEKGCKVMASNSGLISFIKVFKDDKHVVYGFGEVPYHWYLQGCLKPSKELGSGYTIKTIHDAEHKTDAETILYHMVKNPDVKNFTEPTYLTEL